MLNARSVSTFGRRVIGISSKNKAVPTSVRQRRREGTTVLRPREMSYGALLDVSQPGAILLVYFNLIQSGMDPNPAVNDTARVMSVGPKKVLQVSRPWHRL